MILALHMAEVAGHPFCASALCAQDAGEIVCSFGPAYVRPADWQLPASSPIQHRQAWQWGLSLPCVVAVMLQMAENAGVFVAADLPATDAMIRWWTTLSKLNDRRLDAWTRPGPERVSLNDTCDCKSAGDVLGAYLIGKQRGMVA